MITSPTFAGKRYAVLGLARSGVATVEALLASGASVTAWDADEAKRKTLLLPSPSGEGLGVGRPSLTETGARAETPHPYPSPEGEGFLGFADPLALDLAGYDAVIVSPGVPLNRHPIAAHARAANVAVIGDIELFAQARAALPPHRVVGITGTNGKSTTTALVHHICETAALPTLMGGNIGLPILSRDPLPAGGVYVLELSSYQIDLTFTLDCDVAVLLNITPDHLDRYDGFAGYAASKARLFEMSRGVAVIATEDDATRSIAETLRAPAQAGAQLGNVGIGGEAFPTRLLPAQEHRVTEVSSASVPDQSRWPALLGPHNAQNVAAATAVARALGLTDDVIERALRSYPGLPHRMERVATRDGVLFVNDSKATNPTSTAPALLAYPAIHWIVGGLAKTDELDACAPGLAHVRAAYTIGDAAHLFAGLLHGKVPVVTETTTLDAAVRAAAAVARPGETVLLSPACASFDQFADFEARGQAFRAAVEALWTITVTQKSSPGRRRIARIGGRADMSPLGRWFWEIDRVLLLLVTILISVGLIAVAAASPAAGVRYSDGAVQFAPLHYFWKQVIWLVVSVPIMVAVSMLPKETARRMALLGAIGFTLAMVLVPAIGVQRNGATRWIGYGFAQFQPSEFLKPCYVVSLAWLLSCKTTHPRLPVLWLSAGATALVAGLLMLQPDFGQTVMFALMWGALVMLSGAPLKLIGWLAGGGVAMVLAAYEFYSVATIRINNFLHGQGDTYQVDSAHATITGGGLFGTGPGAGVAKFRLPEPHTDYIFSVIGEEFGLIACLAVALIYLAIVVRVFVKLLGEEDGFLLYAAAGLATQFGAQAIINMAVNVGIAPSKGMTLPFISYGGSSMIALSIGFGLLLAFTRRNPYLQRSPYVVTRAAA